MNTTKEDFPYEEIRDSDGNYFPSWEVASLAGYADNQIWSVVEGENDTIVYGPPHHYVNVLGYIATTETHDGQTYYEEEGINDVPDLEDMLEELRALRDNGTEGPLGDTFFFKGVEYKITLNEVEQDN